MISVADGSGQVTPDDRFWLLATELLTRPEVSRSTMMGLPCLRVEGRFFASLDPRTGCLLVKLSREEVQALIDLGDGLPFAPAGRRFREWVAIPSEHHSAWRTYLERALAFVGTT